LPITASFFILKYINKPKEFSSVCFFVVLIGQATAYIIQMLDFLPIEIKDALSHINLQYVFELRLRANKPVAVNYKGQYRYLGRYGLTEHVKNALICDASDVAECIYGAGKFSVYSVEEQIKRGFITAEQGERLGLAGEYVLENGQPHAIRNFTSVCIRVPHEIKGCGKEVYDCCFLDGLKNVMIASPPGQGKTTILRDLARLISENTAKNVLICDERGEIGKGELGFSCDVLKYADKKTAFDAGIRAMRPDLIITDELSKEDCIAVEKAIYSGVIVLASAHFNDIKSIEKPFLGLFDRYVILEEREIGKIKGIYDKNGREIVEND